MTCLLKDKRFAIVLISVVAWIAVAVGTTNATTFVVPNSLTSTEGGSNTNTPFFRGTSITGRFQQVFAASEFGSLSGPEFITQFSLRPDGTFGSAFSFTIPNFQINFSTTSAVPDGLSTVFASNVGPDDTVVFNGSLSLSSSFSGPAGGPKAFDIIVNLQTPFLYDPAAGNLLLDFLYATGSGQTSIFVDAVDVAGDGVSSLIRDTGFSEGLGNIPLTNAFVTQFTSAAPVPEPSTMLLLASGLAGLGFFRWRRKDRKNPSIA